MTYIIKLMDKITYIFASRESKIKSKIKRLKNAIRKERLKAHVDIVRIVINATKDANLHVKLFNRNSVKLLVESYLQMFRKSLEQHNDTDCLNLDAAVIIEAILVLHLDVWNKNNRYCLPINDKN